MSWEIILISPQVLSQICNSNRHSIKTLIRRDTNICINIRINLKISSKMSSIKKNLSQESDNKESE